MDVSKPSKMLVILDKCGWRSKELLARIRIMRRMQFMHLIVQCTMYNGVSHDNKQDKW